MKKSLIALAVLAASSAAMAQSSVTLFGVVDAALAFGRGSLSDRTQLKNTGYQTSRLGFRGTEDLGGGMSAGFWLETGFMADDGSGTATNTNNQASGATSGGGLTFNRRATVSLSGGFGEVRLGRDYSPQYKNIDVFDVFDTVGVGASQVYVTSQATTGGPTIVRASNGISYFLPSNLGGFYGQVQGYFGENPQNSSTPAVKLVEDDGNGGAIRLGYANGPVDVALATSITKFSTGDIKTSNVGASYDFGVVKLLGAYSQDKNNGVGLDGKGWQLGLTAPVGPGLIRAQYSTFKIDTAAADPHTDKLSLGYVHNLSKRTAVYATVAHVRNKNGAAMALNGATTKVNGNSTGYDFGIRHAF
jgi:predicted porin